MNEGGTYGRVLRSWLLLFLFFVFGPAFADEAGVLLWMVDTPEIVDRGSVDGYVSPEGLTVTAARVVATDADGASVYLNLCYDAGDGAFVETEISMAALTSDYRAGPLWASLSGLSDVESYYYAIELGTLVGGSWNILAVSDPHTFAQLENFIQYDTMSVPTDIWSPHAYSAPEPTSGLLFLIGAALLALRRKEVRA